MFVLLGFYVWSYQGSKLRQGFPKLMLSPLYPRSPSAAINKNGKIYLMKVNKRKFIIHFKIINSIKQRRKVAYMNLIQTHSI